MNHCHFSPDRRWRYELIHHWNDLLSGGYEPDRVLPWIGLNPSTADESQLDPTLKRIAKFSQKFGYDGFVMLNLFAWRDTDPAEMMRQSNPVGVENDAVLDSWAKPGRKIVCCWGNHGGHLSRWRKVAERLKAKGAKLMCLDTNADGSPKHPLYVKGTAVLREWVIPKEIVADAWVRRKIRKANKRREDAQRYV